MWRWSRGSGGKGGEEMTVDSKKEVRRERACRGRGGVR